MHEYNIKLEIQPETYDYGEEELVYRIWVIDEKYIELEKKRGYVFNYCQLISERSLPKLNNNEVLLENFSLNINEISIAILLENVKNKKVYVKGANINGIKMSFFQKAEYNDKNTVILIRDYKKYFSL